MSSRNIDYRLNARPADVMAGYLVTRKDEVLDAVVTAAALVAGADRWVDPAERDRLFDFLARNQLMSATPPELRDAFERRAREVREPGGVVAAVNRLGRRCMGQSSLARLVLQVGQEVAVADSRLDPREIRVLELIRTALRGHGAPSATSPRREA